MIYHVSVKWSDVPRIVTKRNEITNRIHVLNDAYEIQRGAHEWREANLAKQLKEFSKQESKLLSDFEALNNKMDILHVQVGAHSCYSWDKFHGVVVF